MKRLKRPVRVFIAFGCNIGDCKKQIETALRLLQKGIILKRVSPLYPSKPYGVENQPDFINGVAVGYTRLKPHALLRFLKSVEKQVGRRKRCRWCEREIDLDIIYYGNLKIEGKELTIPHRDRLNRDFVIIPLAELCPTLLDPIVKRSAKELSLTWKR